MATLQPVMPLGVLTDFDDDFPTALYRLFGADGTLLYAGISDHPKQRIARHAIEKDWWPHVASKTVEWFSTWEAAEAAEKEAVRIEHPVHNVVHAQETPAHDDPSLIPQVRRRSNVPPYQQIADQLRDQILDGTFPPQSRLPSADLIASEGSVAKMTARKALILLRDQGWASFVAGMGTFVQSPDKWPAVVSDRGR